MGGTTTKESRAGFPIVGIGRPDEAAEEAFHKVIERLPSGAGMAFVCILGPRSRHARRPYGRARFAGMPVIEAANGLQVEPNHVYLVHGEAEISKGSLLLNPPPGPSRRFPVDRFFRSLARSRWSSAIGMLLSGDSTDGTFGLAEVRRAGGIALAQETRRAGPASAPVASGTADVVLPPEAVGETLARLAGHPYFAGGMAAGNVFTRSPRRLFENLRSLVCSEDGAGLIGCSRGILEQHAARRMALHDIREVEEYLRLLESDRANLEALREDLRFRPSAFFDDERFFSDVRRMILPHLLRDGPSGRQLRIWIPQSSTGEQAYSVAINILESLEESGTEIPVQIFGTDADASAIMIARKGAYLENIEQDVSPERLRHFFRGSDGSYCVGRAVRELCIFARHYIRHDPPFSKLDLIDGRNLLAWLAPAFRREVYPLLHYALNPSGLLVLGNKEFLPECSELFAPVEGEDSVCLKKAATTLPGKGLPEQRTEAPADYFRNVIQELQATTEETLSKNEELESINEEIEASRRDFQAANEELLTVNEELQNRYAELARLIADMQSLIASVELPMVVVDREVRVRHFTPHAQGIFRLIPADLGRPLEDLQSSLEFEGISSFLRGVIESGSSRETEVRDRDGRWYLMHARAYRTGGDTVGGAVLTLLDITGRKRAEGERERLLQRIETERSQLELVIQQMPAGVVLAEAPSGQVIMANPRVNQIIRHPWPMVGGRGQLSPNQGFRPDGTRYGPEDWPLARSLRNGEVVSDEEIEYVRSDGSRVTMRASSAPIRDGQGNIVAAVLVFDEITEQKILQEKLAQSQKLETIGRLAGGVAHDFNNLLTVITGYTQMLLDDLPPKSRLRNELDIVLQAGNRAIALTSQLLAFSRRQITQPRTFDLNQEVAAMDRMLRRLIGEDIEITTELAKEPCPVHADPGQMEQVLMNLVTNARDAVGQGGKIRIQTANVDLEKTREFEAGRHVLLAVTDNGVGMDAEAKKHLFEPFYTTKGVGRGTGLGLSSVYGIVKQNGGEITVTSEPGKGTRFEVTLPRAPEAAELAGPAAADADLRGSETVLIVEDEAGVRKLARKCLERLGYTVLLAAGGEEALEVSEGRHIDLVLTDLVMPQMDGRELVCRLREHQPGLKVIFTSGYPAETVAGYGVQGVEHSFLQKPFTPHELGQKARKVLDRRISTGS